MRLHRYPHPLTTRRWKRPVTNRWAPSETRSPEQSLPQRQLDCLLRAIHGVGRLAIALMRAGCARRSTPARGGVTDAEIHRTGPADLRARGAEAVTDDTVSLEECIMRGQALVAAPSRGRRPVLIAPPSLERGHQVGILQTDGSSRLWGKPNVRRLNPY